MKVAMTITMMFLAGLGCAKSSSGESAAAVSSCIPLSGDYKYLSNNWQGTIMSFNPDGSYHSIQYTLANDKIYTSEGSGTYSRDCNTVTLKLDKSICHNEPTVTNFLVAKIEGGLSFTASIVELRVVSTIAKPVEGTIEDQECNFGN